jgi:plasmid stabilization system protein ParE
MAITIVWSELSEIQLKEVFEYHSINASLETARRIVNRIIHRVGILEKNPLAGAKEEHLSERKEEYRYLVERNYKIIYWRADDIITIAAVFDSRQNPKKINKIGK